MQTEPRKSPSYTSLPVHEKARMRWRMRALERVKGIEPSYSAWEADVLPLHNTRVNMFSIAHPAGKRKGIFLRRRAAVILHKKQRVYP